MWRYQTGAGHRGSAISYAVGDKQYIATPIGWQQSNTGGMINALLPGQTWRTNAAVVVFTLPEQAP